MSDAAPAPQPHSPPASPQGMPPHAAMMQLILGRWVTQLIATVAKLGIPDLLANGPQSPEALAQASGTHAPSLYRALRALASVGIFAEAPDGRFQLTPLGQTLRSDAPHSVRGAAIMFGEPWSVRAWLCLEDSLRTGQCGFHKAHGEQLFDYLSKNDAAGKIFQDAMISFSGLTRDAVAASYDFSAVKVLVDVAGGVGSLLSTILKAHPHLRGILFDLPEVIAGAPPFLAAQGVADRCSTAAGDFTKAVPAGGDAYMMKHILHDWDDEFCIAVLRNCRKVIPAAGRLLVVETVVEPGNFPALSKLLDIEMLIMTQGGRERNAEDFRRIYEAAGFRLSRVIPTLSPVCIIEGVPV